jgi:hypothetical protein
MVPAPGLYATQRRHALGMTDSQSTIISGDGTLILAPTQEMTARPGQGVAEGEIAEGWRDEMMECGRSSSHNDGP